MKLIFSWALTAIIAAGKPKPSARSVYDTQSASRLIWAYSQWMDADKSSYTVGQHIRDLVGNGVSEVLLGRVTFDGPNKPKFSQALKKYLGLPGCEKSILRDYLRKRYSRVWAIVGGNAYIDDMIKTDLYGTWVPQICQYATANGIDGILIDAYDDSNNQRLTEWIYQALNACIGTANLLAATVDYKLIRDNPYVLANAGWNIKWIPQYFRSPQGYDNFTSIFLNDPYNHMAIYEVDSYTDSRLVFSELVEASSRSTQTKDPNFAKRNIPASTVTASLSVAESAYMYSGGLMLYEVPQPGEAVYNSFIDNLLPKYASYTVKGMRPDSPDINNVEDRLVPQLGRAVDADFVSACQTCIPNACPGGWQSFCKSECQASIDRQRKGDSGGCLAGDGLAMCVCHVNEDLCRPEYLN